MGLYKRGKTYYIDYYFPPGRGGRRIRERIGPSQAEARIVLGERLQDIRQGRDPSLRMIHPRLFDEVVKEFLEKHARHCRDYASFFHNTNILVRYFGGKTLQEITPKAVEDFIAARLAEGVARTTTNRQRSCLSKIFSCAITWGYYGGENPIRKVKRFPETPGRVRFLTADEAQSLVERAPVHLRPVLVCALHTGGRRREILKLKWDDIDLDRGILYFDQTNTKSGKQRDVPISPQLREVLQARKRVRAIGGDAREYVFTRLGKRIRFPKTSFEKARERAGLGEDVKFHTLRHTFASWFVINGGDLYRLQKYLGHSTIALTQRYAHLSPDYLQAGVQFIGAPAKAVVTG